MRTSSAESRLEKACSLLKLVVVRTSGAGWIDDHGTMAVEVAETRLMALAEPLTVAVTVVPARAVSTRAVPVAADQVWMPSLMRAYTE
jgi:hypothetical protein